ncbi:hypothetical protein AJ80_08538 [Polytolypa hystricis UAMH7299]|uniref:Aminotransferase class I/classII large domain-containing protein n=1 Tax=Polytolypa hystricis (strain UAMH7299) TaxID=1447883 RepID=A0A2B7X5U3_POLH7|nr:hypothetical protein AJ80_08538 [Polytolypa hystricis UAMH7299]
MAHKYPSRGSDLPLRDARHPDDLHTGTNRDAFWTPANLQPPVDLSHHFSYATKNRVGSSVKEFYKYFKIPGIHNVAGGMPHVSYFPYDTLEASVALPNRFSSEVDPPIDIVTGRDGSAPTSPTSARLTIPKESDTLNVTKRIDLATALQYGTAEGYPPLHSFIRQFVRENLHPNVPYAGGPEVILTCGSTDGFSKTIEAMTNVWQEGKDWIREREGILCEEFTYMNAIQTAQPRGLNIQSIAMDADGMKATGKGGLADVLDNWDFSRGKRPHLLYTITIGQNPTGAVIPLQRRKEIYAICQKYDIIIVEDDPYWNLQYPSANELSARYRGAQSDPYLPVYDYNAHGRSSGYPFLDSLVPSYLAVDTEGRVIRLDTFSKTIAPGCRLGWLTAQPKVIERITRITETTTQQPSGFVQSMVAGLIMGDQGDDSTQSKSTSGPSWKVDGWVRWLEGLRAEYERRMQSMCTVLEENKFVVIHETSGIQMSSTSCGNRRRETIDEWEIVDKVQMYEFDIPRGGMFVWVKTRLETHPLWSQVPVETLAAALWKHLTKEPFLCLVAPGQMFAATKDNVQDACRYMRLCFTPVEVEEVAKASEGFVKGCASFWQIKDVNEIQDDDDNEDIASSMIF